MVFFITNIFFAFCAAISPGPNIIITTQNSAIYGRKAGLITAFGVLTGVAFWFVLLIFGLELIFSSKKLLFFFHIFTFLYLLFIAYLISKTTINENTKNEGNKKFFFESFFMTLLNPEIAIFYASILSGIFTQIEVTKSVMFLYVFSFMIVESIVFITAALAVSSVQKFMLKYLQVIKLISCIGILYYAFTIFMKIKNDFEILQEFLITIFS